MEACGWSLSATAAIYPRSPHPTPRLSVSINLRYAPYFPSFVTCFCCSFYFSLFGIGVYSCSLSPSPKFTSADPERGTGTCHQATQTSVRTHICMHTYTETPTHTTSSISMRDHSASDADAPNNKRAKVSEMVAPPPNCPELKRENDTDPKRGGRCGHEHDHGCCCRHPGGCAVVAYHLLAGQGALHHHWTPHSSPPNR